MTQSRSGQQAPSGQRRDAPRDAHLCNMQRLYRAIVVSRSLCSSCCEIFTPLVTTCIHVLARLAQLQHAQCGSALAARQDVDVTAAVLRRHPPGRHLLDGKLRPGRLAGRNSLGMDRVSCNALRGRRRSNHRLLHSLGSRSTSLHTVLPQPRAANSISTLISHDRSIDLVAAQSAGSSANQALSAIIVSARGRWDDDGSTLR